MSKRKRRIDVKRLSLVAGAAVILVAALGTAIGFAVKKISKPAEIKLADGSVLEPVDLPELRSQIEDVFKISSLKSLKEDIHTYLFNNQLDDLKTQINDYLKSQNADPSKIAWAIQDLTTGAFVESDNASDNFTAASTYKLPLMMLWYQKVANGEVSMDTPYLFSANMKEAEDYENPTQPIVRKYRVGDSIPLANLLEAGALYSDNVAGHILFENLGGYSAYKTQALQYSDDPQDTEFTSSAYNVLNPNYTMDLAKELYQDQGTYDELKYWLQQAGTNMFLNKNGYKGYIQKVGNIDEVRNVIGYLPGEFPYSVSVYSCIDKEQGEQIISDIGDICYSYFAGRYNNGDYESYPLEERISKGQVTVVPDDPISRIPDLPEEEINANIIRRQEPAADNQDN